MNLKKAKTLRRWIEAKFADLSNTPTYNLTPAEMTNGKETLYLTVDCKRFFYQQFKHRSPR